MSHAAPGLGLEVGFIDGFDGWGGNYNNDMRKLSSLAQGAVLSRVAALPGSPTDGNRYLLTATADDKKIAVRDAGAWVLYTPLEGWKIWVSDEDKFYIFDGTAWGIYSAPAAGAAPDSADYLVKTANGSLSAERVVTDTPTITWDWSTSGQAKATFSGAASHVTNDSGVTGSTVKAALDQLESEIAAAVSGGIPTSYLDTDGTLAANSDSKIATQKAAKTYIDQIIAAQDAMVFKGVIDCSANPNYPAADRGWTYRVSVAGKIGGASGINVETGDLLLCLDDGTASGTQPAQGSHWSIAQTNLDGAVIGPVSAIGDNFALFDSTSGKLLKDGGLSRDTDTALAANSDSRLASQKAVKAYVDGQPRPYVVGGFFNLTPTTSEGLLRHVFTEAVTFADDFSGSQGYCGTNPTATFTIDVKKNGSSVGSIAISTSGVFTFLTTGTTVSFAAGDRLEIIAPGTADATVANVGFSLKGTR